MSKQGTSRSRADKARSGATAVVVPITNDIVPGKFTEYDLNLCIEEDNVHEFIFSIVENIMQDTEKNITEKHLNNRVVPFVVDLAKNAMLQIIEWNFLYHDQGESNDLEHVWIEDEEPESCMIDSWAQGYFPKRQASFEFSHNPTEITELVLEENSKLEDSEEESFEKFSPFMETESNSPSLMEKEEQVPNEKETEIEEEFQMTVEPEPEPEVVIPKKIKTPFKPYRGKLNFDDLNMLTETLSETEERLELEKRKREAKLLRGTSGRSIASHQVEPVDYEKKVIQKLFGATVKNVNQLRPTDILLNTNDQLVAMMKIPGDQIVQQRIKANHKTLESGSNKVNLTLNKEHTPKKRLSNERGILNQSKPEDFRSLLMQNDKHPLPVSMLDSIDPVPGVTVQEGDRIKKSSYKKLEREQQMEKQFLRLRPVKNQCPDPTFMIHDIINLNKMSLKPMGSAAPIPPIPDGFQIFE